MCDNKVKIWD